MKGMSDFTREDEEKLEMLRSSKELGYLQLDETKMLQQLEQKYDAFIKEGLRNLACMAPRQGRPCIKRTVLISCALTTAALSIVSFILLLKTRNTEKFQWDGRVGLIVGAMDIIIMVMSILLLFSRF
ncbi:hypothetical protein LSM04_003532 [Trypanosoma melophagium]|uniref:uncharacterized protein n=1 Tax=Trypanosoma melophagium TaxID=715481 RepID=UPI00351A7996|nr:hypothetical protein LSM04_003532 [Trypanosoma melophagium]